MIRHTVVFSLKQKKGVKEAPEFFKALQDLANIPGVLNFEILKQTGTKNSYDFGVSMEFENSDDYKFYSNYPDHNQFVEKFWKNEVEDFMEIDYEPLMK